VNPSSVTIAARRGVVHRSSARNHSPPAATISTAVTHVRNANDPETRIAPASTSGHPGGTSPTGWPLYWYPRPSAMLRATEM